MQPVFLWTDLLVYVLCLSVFSFVWRARKKEYLLAPWKQVIRSRLGAMASIILLAYVSVGLMDSVHFKLSLDAPDKNGKTVYSSEVISLFDWLVDPVRLAQEKTYSAPFATHLYSKETIELADGTQVRAYQRLEYGGAHLEDTAKRWDDVLQITLTGFLKGMLIWALFCLVIIIALSARWKNRLHRRLVVLFKGVRIFPGARSCLPLVLLCCW